MSSSQTTIPLSQLKRGQTATLAATTLGASESDTLRAMGLRPDCALRLCRHGEPCIVAVGDNACGCRIGLSRAIADRVLVSITP